MQSLKKTSLIVASFGALALAGGVLATVAFGATSKKRPAHALKVSTSTTTTGTFKSNEDATHEAGESAADETAENSGQRPHGGHDGLRGGSNEDATHESGESAAREAAEDAAKTTTTTP